MISLSIWDWLILVAFMLGLVCLSLYLGKRQKNVQDFCLASRKMNWFPTALSMLTAAISAITMVGVPIYIFRYNLQLSAIGLLCCVPLLYIVGSLMIPVLYRLKIYTIFEYVGRRYHPAMQTVIAVINLLVNLSWIGSVIYVTALILSGLTRLPIWSCVMLIGLVVTLYTSIGGIETVIWANAIQFFVVIGGLMAMAILMITQFKGGLAGIWQEAAKTGSTKMFDFSFNFQSEAVFWAVLASNIVETIGMFGTNQTLVQKCFAAKNTKNATWSVVGCGLVNIPFALLLVIIGLGLAAFFHAFPEAYQALLGMDPDKSKALDKAFAYFIIHKMPVGLAGLMVAGIFAISMSTLDSAINSMGTVMFKDIIERHFRTSKMANERYCLRIMRLLTVLLGITATILALFVGNIGTIVKISVVLMAFVGAPLYGIFFLGLFTKRANTFGVICGSIVSYVFCPIAYFALGVNWMWLVPVNTVVVMIFGYLSSIFYRHFTGNKALSVYTWDYKEPHVV